MLVLTWNLFHGRLRGGRAGDHRDAFAAALARWDWDVALLQEVPPWWPAALGRACRAHARWALTSRNELAALRRALARRAPDLMGSWGGGANAILVRGAAPLEHRRTTLRRLPERRVAHAVALASGPWVANLHGQAHSERLALADLRRAVARARGWARGAPLVVGGDLNLRHPAPWPLARAGGHSVDHLLVDGLEAAGPVRTLDAGALSDHLPVLAELRMR